MQTLRKEGKRQCATNQEKGTIHEQELFRNLIHDKSKPLFRGNNLQTGWPPPTGVNRKSASNDLHQLVLRIQNRLFLTRLLHEGFSLGF